MARPFLLALFTMLLAGCSNAGGDGKSATAKFNGPGRMKIVCTTGMVADLAKHIGGVHVTVAQLMNAGVDPHLYKASPGDIQSLHKADLILYSGKHLEGKMADLLENLSKSRRTLAVTDGIAETSLLKTAEGITDPHLWFDVSLWRQAALAVRDQLMDYDPSHEADYRGNWQDYDAQLEKLHASVKERIAQIERSRRVLVTAHDAFEYFGRAYAIEVRSIQGISTESEASVKQVNDLVDFLVQRQIKAVFVESSVPEKNIKALVEGCAARGHKVVIGGELFSDAMGPAGQPEGTYVGMVNANVETIVRALK